MENFQKAIESSFQESKNKQFIKPQIINGVLFITFNRPKRMNAFTAGMYMHLAEILKNAQSDDNVRLVVVQGEGKFFSSGNDLANFQLVGDVEDKDLLLEMNTYQIQVVLAPVQQQLITFNKPLIASVHGGAIGFSFTMLGLFDYVLITKQAFFEAPLVALAQGPEFCSSVTFPKLFGKSKAFDILVRGKRILADEIQKTDFVTLCLENKEELQTQLNILIEELLELDQTAVINAKQLLNRQDIDELLENSVKECENYTKLCTRKEVIQQAVMKRISKQRPRL